jgi:hypothetical protein
MKEKLGAQAAAGAEKTIERHANQSETGQELSVYAGGI